MIVLVEWANTYLDDRTCTSHGSKDISTSVIKSHMDGFKLMEKWLCLKMAR